MQPIILLVEDDEDDISFFKDALLSICPDCNFLYAHNGLEAIKKLNLLKPVKPHFIFVDLNMPVMNGFEFLKEIKKVKSFTDIPTYVLTTANEPKLKEESLEAGANDFFTKPVRIEDLKILITRVTGILQEH
jgi:CheY-like chemotaxis protein